MGKKSIARYVNHSLKLISGGGVEENRDLNK